jgi:hypothetical protein
MSTTYWKPLLFGLLLLYALVALAHNTAQTLDTTLGYDFFSYWQPLQFVRQGINPYTQGLQGYANVLAYPIYYVNGVEYSETWLDVLGSPLPANTPVMLLLLFPLGFFTWEVAKIIWFGCNLIWVVVSIALVLRLVTGKWQVLYSSTGILFALIVLCLLPTRNTLGNGQTTYLIIMCILLSLYFYHVQRKSLAGLALGIALSKYTLGIASLFYFIYKRQWRILAFALAVQLAGFIILSLITDTNPVVSVIDYTRLVAFHTEIQGIHLGNYIALPPIVVSVVVTGLFAVFFMYILQWYITNEWQEPYDIYLFALSCNWALLTIYHAYYDAALLIFTLGLLMNTVGNNTRLQLASWARRLLIAVIVFCALSLALPGAILRPFLPVTIFHLYLKFLLPLATVTILVLTASLLFVMRFFRNTGFEAI